MCPWAMPFLATVVLWWSSTALILLLDSRDQSTRGLSMAGATSLLVLALWLIGGTADETTARSAYVAFICGLAVWGWQLLGFYTGFISGPNKSPCAPCSGEFSRFIQAVGTSFYHELAAILGAIAVAALTRDQPNKVALWTYLILWGMHSSAKLNLFLGVPNLGVEMLPQHLSYLTSFMRQRTMNALFPISVTVGSVCATLLVTAACSGEASAFERVGFAMLGSLMALAVIEHWFLVIPLDGNALWLGFRRGGSADRLVEFAIDDAFAAKRTNQEAGLVDAFRADPPHVCSARNIERLLETIAAGRFGAVECVRGLVRTEGDWVMFELKEGRARIAAFGPRALGKPFVIARGQGFDRAGLKAAFDSCAAAA